MLRSTVRPAFRIHHLGSGELKFGVEPSSFRDYGAIATGITIAEHICGEIYSIYASISS